MAAIAVIKTFSGLMVEVPIALRIAKSVVEIRARQTPEVARFVVAPNSEHRTRLEQLRRRIK